MRELGQVAADGLVEVEQALVDQLHHQRCRPELGGRPDLEHRIGRGLDARGQAQQPGGSVDDLAVGQDGERGARDPVLATERGQGLVDPGVDLLKGAHGAIVRRIARALGYGRWPARPGWADPGQVSSRSGGCWSG